MSIKLQDIVRGIVTVLLCAALGAAAPAPAAMNRRAPINWGGGGAQSARSSVPQYRQWRPLWRYVWSRTQEIYDMRPAPTVAGSPSCPRTLGLGPTVEHVIDTIDTRRYGDTVRALGQFQTRLLCLNVDGAHGVDFALSAFNALAAQDLRGRERYDAVVGSFNLGLLSFDAIQYSGRSWWLPVMAHEYGTERSLIADYPGRRLGLWLYNVQDGRLHQLTFGGHDWGVYRGLMRAFAHPALFDRGECSLLGMAAQGFSCGRGGSDNRSMGSGTGSGGGGGIGGMGGGSGGGLSCMLSAAMHTGSLGSLSCMARTAGLGGMHLPTTAAAHVQIRGVIDSQCAANDDGGSKPKLPQYNPKKSGSAHPNADKVGHGVLHMILHLIGLAGGGGKSKPSSSGSAAHHSGGLHKWNASDTTGLLNRNAAEKAREQAMKKRAAARHHLKKFKSGGSGRSIGGGNACGGHGTNAAAQVAAMFACTGTGSTRGGMSASGPRFPGAGGGGPFSMPGPGGGGGAPGALLSCAMQGGGLVRTSRNDKRCQQSYCAPGASCSCNGSGGGSAPSSVTAAGRRKITSPNNMNRGAMDFGRNHVGNSSGFTGPKLPTFGGGPSKQ